MALFDTFTISKVQFKNRILTPCFTENLAREDGRISHVCFENYMKVSKQGAGAVILDSVYVTRQGKSHPLQVGISEEEHLAGLSNLVKYLKENETVVGIRLSHAGAKTSEEICGIQPIGPSIINFGKDFSVSREFDDFDVEELSLFFVHAAERAEEADFDFIEINCTQQHLFEQCLDSRLNKRTDMYGSSNKNRIRLLCKIICDIRKRIKNSMLISLIFPVSGKLGDDYTEASIKNIIHQTEQAGVNIFHPLSTHAMNKFGESDFTPLEITAQYTKKPIIIEGNIKTLSILKDIITIDKAILFGLDKVILGRSNWYQFLHKKIAS